MKDTVFDCSASNLAAEIADKSMEWVADTPPYFDPLEFDSDGERLLREKSFAELGMSMMYFSTRDRDIDKALSDLVFRVANTEAYHGKVAGNPENIVFFAHPVVATHLHDKLEESGRRTLDEALRDTDLAELEFYIYQLDLYNICQFYGWEGLALDPHLILETSSLDPDLSAVSASIMDGYEITHLPMYVHNFGSGRHEPMNSYVDVDFEQLIEGLILRFMLEPETDLVIELALAGLLDGTISDKVLHLVLSWAAEFVRELGYVPTRHGSNFSLLPTSALEELDTWEDEFAEFAKNYHTVLMSALMGDAAQGYLQRNTVERPTRDEADQLVELGRCLARASGSDSADATLSLDESVEATSYPQLYNLVDQIDRSASPGE